jgi:asparagine synthetase B (glutamine-hydrolysing)
VSVASDVAQRLRRCLQEETKQKRGARIGIALSGGVDSCSVLGALLDNGIRPVVVSYTPDTHESTDHAYAARTAAVLSLPFHSAVVAMSPENLEREARVLTRRGYRTKLEVECLAPMLEVLRTAEEVGVGVLYTGDQADGYYINSNWMARNYDRAQGIPGYLRKPVSADADAKRIDELRRIYYEEDRSCSGALVALGKEMGLEVRVPYRALTMRQAFHGTHWRDVNTPRLKEPVWLAYGHHFNRTFPVRPKPVNLHRGDSRFAETMGRALMARLPGPWRTPTGLYAAMARGEI